MADEFKLPNADVADFETALERFLLTMRIVSCHFDNEVVLASLGSNRGADELALMYEPSFEGGLSEQVELGYAVVRYAPDSFPDEKFMLGVQRALEELSATLDRQADAMHLSTRFGKAFGKSLAQTEADVVRAWRVFREAAYEIQDELRVFEVRAGLAPRTLKAWRIPPISELRAPTQQDPTEVAPRPSDQASDVQTTDEALSRSQLEAGREWTLVIREMENEALEDERAFDAKDVTDKAAYDYLVQLLKDQGRKPSQTFPTWRKYVGKFRMAANTAKRPRRLS
jgi:hypothetical protein